MFKQNLRPNRPAADTTRRKLWRLSGHPFVIPVITFMVLFFVAIAGFISLSGTTEGANDAKVISLKIDGEEQVIPTRATTVADLLKRLNITLGEKDIVTPGLATPIEEDGFSLNIYRARPVLVVDGDIKTVTVTAEPTLAAVVQSVGVVVYPEDKLVKTPVNTTNTSDLLNDGLIAEQVVIDRATPANLNLYGTPVPVRTHADTVDELLKEKEIKLNQGDTLQPDAATPITPDIQVFVVRVGQEIAQVEEDIAPPTTFVDDYELTLGQTQVKDPGAPGKKLVTYEIEQANGVEVGRRIIQEIVVTQPVGRVVARGRKAPVVAGHRSEIMSAAGIPANQHYAADFIISHESGWRVNALNARGCAGLGQACPGSKLANACPSWQSDAVCQMRFFNSYAVNRYGSWPRAMEIWQQQRWW